MDGMEDPMTLCLVAAMAIYAVFTLCAAAVAFIYLRRSGRKPA
jgi:hypothetical protein